VGTCTGRSLGVPPLSASSVTLFSSLSHLATTAQLGNRRLKQDKVSARLARVEPDDRTTLCGECETFRLAIQIAQPPRIEQRSSAATHRKIIEPRNRAGLVTEQIEAAIRTDLEVTEVGAGCGQCLVGTPDCESNEPVVASFDRPPLAARDRECGGPNSMSAAGFFSLATSKFPPGSSTTPSPRDPFGSDHACAISPRPSTTRSINATASNALRLMSSTRGGVS
jgi:hypothetical protein